MTHCSNQLRTTHGPRTAAPSRAAASRALRLRTRTPGDLLPALAITALITVLVLITGQLSAEYGFV